VNVPDVELLLTIPQTAKALNLGRTKVYELLADGSLKSVWIGRARRIPVDEVRRYVRELQSAA
jgi:excisionase family DNA binding protein